MLKHTFAQILEHVQTHRFDGGLKGVAIFSNGEGHAWHIIESPLELRTQLFVSHDFFVHPLMAILDDYEPFVGALIDKKQAKMYLIHAGTIEDSRYVLDEQKKNDRNIDTSFKNDMDRRKKGKETLHDQKLLNELEHFVRKHKVKRLILGGPKGTLDGALNILPKSLAQLLIGTFHAELFLKDPEIIEHFVTKANEFERKEEQEKVAFIQTSGTKSVRGIEEVIDASNKGMIHELVADFETSFEGMRCDSCALLQQKNIERSSICAHCGGHLTVMSDVTPEIIQKTARSGGKIEFVHSTEDISDISGIGAVLKTHK